ncbi:MAG TPA: hypothetical protein VOA87_05000 [Thermoanaerobaculia bacterium]|nr:hypothetical protein [Thermoanaerobaculia bacterium]
MSISMQVTEFPVIFNSDGPPTFQGGLISSNGSVTIVSMELSSSDPQAIFPAVDAPQPPIIWMSGPPQSSTNPIQPTQISQPPNFVVGLFSGGHLILIDLDVSPNNYFFRVGVLVNGSVIYSNDPVIINTDPPHDG